MADEFTLPRTRKLTIIAQDPSIKGFDGKVLKTEIEIPAEELASGPRGYRVHVIDYDASTGKFYIPVKYEPPTDGVYPDPFCEQARTGNDDALLKNPCFHAQNVYAIIMRTLSRFEFALGRRIGWGFYGHQIHVAPHAFADANAFYSEKDRALLFGYFRSPVKSKAKSETIFSCLSHDVVVHEATHAILDGLKERYTDPSSPQQAGFHEGFADVAALLSVFSLKEVVGVLLGKPSRRNKTLAAEELISAKNLTFNALSESVLFGLAEQMGEGLSGLRGNVLRRSVRLKPLKPDDAPDSYTKTEEFKEPHRCGELLVASMLRAFLRVWVERLEKLQRGHKQFDPHSGASDALLDRGLVIEEGAKAAGHLLTMAIRALDYAPPTDIDFGDYLSALLTADRETVPDDSAYGYRKILRESFREYGIVPSARNILENGIWAPAKNNFLYDRTHFDSLLRDPDEVFRFLWDNREALDLNQDAYTEVQSVRPCLRMSPDGFTVRETVAEYVQMLALRAAELEALNIDLPNGMPPHLEVTIYGGGNLVFDEYGQLKYHIAKRIDNQQRQTAKLKYLWQSGYFTDPAVRENIFARMHLNRAIGQSVNIREEF